MVVLFSSDSSKEFFDIIGQKVKESDKVDITNLINTFLNTRYDDAEGIKN